MFICLPVVCCRSHFDVIHFIQYMQWCVIGNWLEFAWFHRRGNKIHLIQSSNDIIHIVTAKRTNLRRLFQLSEAKDPWETRLHADPTLPQPPYTFGNQKFFFMFQQDNWFLLLLFMKQPCCLLQTLFSSFNLIVSMFSAGRGVWVSFC